MQSENLLRSDYGGYDSDDSGSGGPGGLPPGAGPHRMMGGPPPHPMSQNQAAAAAAAAAAMYYHHPVAAHHNVSHLFLTLNRLHVCLVRLSSLFVCLGVFATTFCLSCLSSSDMMG